MAGCATLAGPAVPTASAGTDARQPDARLELAGCQRYLLGYRTDTSRLEPFLPPGYRAGADLATTAAVDLNVFACDSALLGNTTAVHDLQWFRVAVDASVPSQVRSDAAPDEYVFENVVNSPVVQEFFQRQGIRTSLGAVEAVRQGASTTLRLHAGTLLYEYAGSGELGATSFPASEGLRYHQASGSRASWYDFTFRGNLFGYLNEQKGTLTAHGGFIAQTLLEPGNATATGLGAGQGTMILSFPTETENRTQV